MAPPKMTPLKYLEGGEEGLTQELKDFLSTLPKQKWLTNEKSLYQYQGFWYIASILQGTLKFQEQFTAQPTDLFLVSTPKSGTTWLKAMGFAIVNRTRYHTSDPQNPHPLLTSNPHELIPFTEFAYFANQVPDFTGLDSPRLFATHLPYTMLPESVRDSKCKIVYLSRNPKDTFISFWCFINKLYKAKLSEPIPLEVEFEKFCEGASPYGPFWDHVLGYWKESLEKPERVCFLKYEDVKREPIVHLRKLGEFLGCPFSAEEENEGALEGISNLCSFDNLSNLDVNKEGECAPGFENNTFFRRGEVGDWMNHLTPEMVHRLDRINEEKLLGSGLKF